MTLKPSPLSIKSKSNDSNIPRVLVIDDQLGDESAQSHALRFAFCKNHRLVEDCLNQEGDVEDAGWQPKARVSFLKGQYPLKVQKGDTVKNILNDTLESVRLAYECVPSERIACVFVDLKFITGEVIEVDRGGGRGNQLAPKGNADDDNYFGLVLVQEIKRRFPNLPVVVLTGHDSTPDIRATLDDLNVPFLSKSDKEQIIGHSIAKFGLYPDYSGLVVGQSLPILKALREARIYANSPKRFDLFVDGESGVGKTNLAMFFHEELNAVWGRGGDFVHADCGAFTDTLFESELFGQIEGAFTNAHDKESIFEQAKSGTLFFDEVANMPVKLQNKLLVTLQERKVVRVGENHNKARQFDVQVISATNVNILDAIANGSFKEDLFARLAFFRVSIPPLRDRIEDVPYLVEHFLRQLGTGKTFTEDALARLMDHHWPRNIRDLHSTVARSEAGCIESEVRAKDIKFVQASDRTSRTNAERKISSNQHTENAQQSQTSLSVLLDQMKSVTVTRKKDLDGSWTKLRSATAVLAANLLEECLDQTADGETPNLTRAYRLITGEEVAASNKNKPGDLVRDIREIEEHAIQDLLRGGTKLSVVNKDLVKRDRYRKAANTDLGEAIMVAIVSIQNDSNAIGALNQARANLKSLDDYMQIWHGAECFPTGVVAIGFATELLQAATHDPTLASYLAKVQDLCAKRRNSST